jgi:hypothetical protein
VHNRADLSRNVDVVALFLTAIPTNVAAREFPAGDPADGKYPTLRAPQAGAELAKRLRKVK